MNDTATPANDTPDRRVPSSDTRCEMTWIVMPGQTNALGTVFGGQIMAWIDVCAAVSAQRFARSMVVTASMDSLSFRAPVRQGNVVVLQSSVNWAGSSSMEVGVRVESEDPLTGERSHTSSAYLTFVALDANREKATVPTLVPETAVDLRRAQQAQRRRAQRLALRDKDPS